MPSAVASTARVNSSREPVRATCASTQGTTRWPTTRTRTRNRATLPRVRARVSQQAAAADLPGEAARVAAQHAGQRRQQDQRQDHGQVLDDQPADGDPAGAGIERAALLQRAQQDDRAGDREREAEDEAGAEATSPRGGRSPCPSAVATAIWPRAPGMAILRTAIRSSIEKCRPTPNIKQDDADLGELAGQLLVADEARRERPDRRRRPAGSRPAAAGAA